MVAMIVLDMRVYGERRYELRHGLVAAPGERTRYRPGGLTSST